MEDLTCINCGVRFVAKLADGAIDYQRAKEEHKEHFKSDWHRYNLKRKILELPPITAEAFAEKVLQKRAEENKSEAFSGRCSLCNKTFASANAFENHIKSRKHRELERATNMKTEVKNNIVPGDKTPAESNPADDAEEVEMTGEDGDEEEWMGEGLGLEECLFCTKVSKTMEKNIAHMSLVHSFFIPDADCVCDLEGLMQYLGQLVGEYHMCLWCKADKFLDTTSIQQHMVDKGHCKMLRDKGDIFEFADFYDYRKTYKDESKGSEKQENGEETQNDDEEEEVEPFVMDDTAAFMVLPSGASIGHRDLVRYFRQKLQPDKRVILYRNSSTVSKVVQHYKALGWTGTTGVAAEQKAKDIAYSKRIQSRHFMKLGVNANRLQRHFRDQVFGF